MRSKLFVPGSRPELFAKALAGPADALSLDLEDSVAAARKAEAREGVRAMLAGTPAGHGKTIIVRVNAMDTPYFADDVAAVVLPGVHMINLPKPGSPDEVRAASEAIARAEKANGVTVPVGLLLNIESPQALHDAAALAKADKRVVGLQMGLADMFEPINMDRRETAAIQQAMFAVRMAAGQAGVFAYDSVFPDIKDTEGFRAEAALARRMGFLGKSCIHPTQVPLANEAFRPSDAEIAHALKVVEAAAKADSDGVGAYVVDGKMIDIPFVIRARAIVESARGMGLLPGA
jgi:citrate lyase subunit beta/citryl-CoA lyase